MATYTSNLNLKKPASNDYVNIADINGNMDILDKAVLIDNAQTISGQKTFTSRATFEYYNPILKLDTGHNIGFNIQLNVDEYNVAPLADKAYIHTVLDRNNTSEARFQFFHGTSGAKVWRANITKNDGTEVYADLLRVPPDGTVYMATPHRSYSSASNDDVLVKSHVAELPVVHLTGNETIAGTKTIQNAIINYLTVAGTDYQRRIQINRTDDNANTRPASVIAYPIVSWNDAGGNRVCALQVNHLTNGAYELCAAVRNADGTDKYITLVSGNA